jgi:type I restriction enzyme S subunit
VSDKKNKSLKSGWRQVKFGDVVQLSKARSQDPLAEGIERYVGLEHLEPGDLRIRSWGNVADGVTFTSVFKPGQVLFGKRRAYQRKVAVADFSGVCSGDIYVLETKDSKVLLPELLPFICQTDAFFDHAVGTSAGSLSPRTNWTSLADFLFPLPPADEQGRIISAIGSALACELAFEEARNAAAALFHSASAVLLDPAETWIQKQLQDVATVERGKFSHRPRNLPEFFGGPYPFVQTGDIVASTGDLRGASQMLSDEGLTYSKSFPKDTILITIAANIGFTAITTQETWCPDSVVGIVPKDGTDVRFLEYVLRTKQKHLENHVATQTAQKNINLQDLKPLRLDMPDIAVQKEIADQLLRLERAVADLDGRLATARNLRVKLANETIGVADV